MTPPSKPVFAQHEHASYGEPHAPQRATVRHIKDSKVEEMAKAIFRLSFGFVPTSSSSIFFVVKLTTVSLLEQR